MRVLMEELAKALYKKFFYNSKVYATQEIVDGRAVYITRYKRMNANKLLYFLNENKSIMAYQQVFDKLKWVCLDFDIKSSFIDARYDFFNDKEFRPKLETDVKHTIKYLDNKSIKYLLEFSGNRGIHLWIFFDSPITKSLGYTILEKISSEAGLEFANDMDSCIGLDHFPKVPSAKTNKIGKGVKIPNSFHKKSERYCYLLDNSLEMERISERTEDFVKKQISCLSMSEDNIVGSVINSLGIHELKNTKAYHRINAQTDSNYTLSQIKDMLSKSEYFERIFSKDVGQWSEIERKVVTGTLIRLKDPKEASYGKKLLEELFASADNYDEERTKFKLQSLKNYYPPSIEYLKEIFSFECEFCESNNIKSAVELIDNAILEEKDDFEFIIDWTIRSEKKYLTQNDEVPLNQVYDEIASLNQTLINEQIVKIVEEGEKLKPDYYIFLRHESEEKTRQLYGLSAKDRVISTAIMRYIYDCIGSDIISSTSFSYRINTNPMENDIFESWNDLWRNFVKEVTGVLEDHECQNYYVIRLDISKFYDEINIDLLQNILHAKANEELNNKYIELSLHRLGEEARKKYYNACNYLISLCRQCGDSAKGVPQGPAFARFLAEIYLSSFDNFLQKNLDEEFDFAYRYVDDYYIFLQKEDRYQNVISRLSSELAKLYLTANEKFISGQVLKKKKDVFLKDEFKKYFIDEIDESMPKALEDKAKIWLNEMFRNIEETDNIKDFPFFLTHLVDEKYRKKSAEKIIDKVVNSDIGRGSVFKHFYKNIGFKYSDLSYFKDIRGLSRANFINYLVSGKEDISMEKLDEIISYFTKDQTLKNYEKVELIRGILSKGIEPDAIAFISDNFDDVIMVIDVIKEINWSTSVYRTVLEAVGNLPNKKRSITLLEKILSVSKGLPDVSQIINKIYALLEPLSSETMENADGQILLNLVGFYTLYNDDIDRTNALWTKLINRKDVHSLDTKQWYKYDQLIKCSTINGTGIIAFFNERLQDNSAARDQKPTDLEKEFTLNLLTFLYGDEECKKIIDKELKKMIESVAEEKNNILLKWLLNGARYLFAHDVAIENHRVNDRLVLINKNNSEILVRGSKKIFEDEPKEENWGGYAIHKYYKIYKASGVLNNFNDLIHGKNIIESLKIYREVSKQIDDGKIFNVFEKGTFVDKHAEIYYTHSSHDKEFFFEGERGERQTVKKEKIAVQTKMLKILSEKSTRYRFVDVEKELSDIFVDIIPMQHKLIRKNKKQILFVDLFIEEMDKFEKSGRQINNMYEFETLKFDTIVNFVNLIRKEESDKSKELVAIGIYNTYSEKDSHLLYAKTDVNKTDINLLLDSIKESTRLNVHSEITEYVKKIADDYKACLRKNINDYSKLKKVEITVNASNETVKIDGVNYQIDSLKCILLERNDTIEVLTEDRALDIDRQDLVFFGSDILVIFPKELIRMVEIIENKSDKYDLAIQESEKSYRQKVMNAGKFGAAKEIVIVQNQCAERIAEEKIFAFLRNVDGQYWEAILEVISSYKTMDNDSVNRFIEILKEYLEDDTVIVMPLKDYIYDRNGLDVIFNEFGDFDRNQKYDKLREKSTNLLITSDEKIISSKKHLVICSDIAISATQFTKAFNRYKSGEANHMREYYDIKFGTLKTIIESCEEISFVNCIYTPFYANTVIKYMQKEFNVKESKLNFEGNELNNYEDYLFKKIHQKHREKFLEYVRKQGKKLLGTKLADGKTYEEYLSICEDENSSDRDLMKTMLVLRRNSMPKLHHIIFDDKIFSYRPD